jgi:hypothetical protein
MRHFKCKNCCLNLLCISIICLTFFIMNLSDSTWIQTIIFQSINSRNFFFFYELWKFVYLSWTYDKVFISTALLLLHSIAWKKISLFSSRSGKKMMENWRRISQDMQNRFWSHTKILASKTINKSYD